MIPRDGSRVEGDRLKKYVELPPTMAVKPQQGVLNGKEREK
jgi:hypothetical protein